MNISIEFDTGNAAFEDYGFTEEVERVLQQAAKHIAEAEEQGASHGSYRLYDTNGNAIGLVTIKA